MFGGAQLRALLPSTTAINPILRRGILRCGRKATLKKKRKSPFILKTANTATTTISFLLATERNRLQELVLAFPQRPFTRRHVLQSRASILSFCRSTQRRKSICLSACIQGRNCQKTPSLPERRRKRQKAAAKEICGSLFGKDHYYIRTAGPRALQREGIVAPNLSALARKLDIRLSLQMDIHYCRARKTQPHKTYLSA